ncbi:MAG: TIGR02922 family protein [Cognaticolwellia aestuarii]
MELTVTIIYYQNNSLELHHAVRTLPVSESGRVIISEGFKLNKSIVAVCKGEITILNKIGDRILTVPQEPDD